MEKIGLLTLGILVFWGWIPAAFAEQMDPKTGSIDLYSPSLKSKRGGLSPFFDVNANSRMYKGSPTHVAGIANDAGGTQAKKEKHYKSNLELGAARD